MRFSQAAELPYSKKTMLAPEIRNIRLTGRHFETLASLKAVGGSPTIRRQILVEAEQNHGRNNCTIQVPLISRPFRRRRSHSTDSGAQMGAAAHLKGLPVEEAISFY